MFKIKKSPTCPEKIEGKGDFFYWLRWLDIVRTWHFKNLPEFVSAF